jgi:ATP-dependent exoDNAse (exonuclease V) beta subunit
VAQALPALGPDDQIGILLFSRTHLPHYLRALYQAGLSVRVREGRKLAESLTVRHLHNLARALTRPQDDLAWAAVLRGAWAAQPLHLLAQVARSPGEVWPEKLGRLAESGDGPGELAELARSLAVARSQVGRRPLADILSDWLAATDAWMGIAAWEGPLGVANARTYLDLLAATADGLPEAAFRKADFNLAEAFQPPDPRAQASPVEILTVHGAKGLEFHQVFLPFLDWQPLKSGDDAPPFLLEEIPESRLHGLALARPYGEENQGSFYRLLRGVKNQRLVDEARRVFYVAVTRARQRLVMSAVVKPAKKPGHWQVSGDSPLAWLTQHYRPGLPPAGEVVSWSQPDIQVERLTAVPPLAGEAAPPRKAAAPWEFFPEAAPYEVRFPSRAPAPPPETPPPLEAAGEAPRLRGEVTHRALETLARGGPLPEAASMAAALRQGGLPAPAAAALAAEIFIELEACRADPFLAALLRPDLPWSASEWLIEDQPAPGFIRRGAIDLLAFDGRHWWLLDFKTSRPAAGAGWEEFMAREAEKHRPQLQAYREMTAKAKGIEPPESIRLGVYFTACRRVMEL